jgi:hypothetical protein
MIFTQFSLVNWNKIDKFDMKRLQYNYTANHQILICIFNTSTLLFLPQREDAQSSHTYYFLFSL